MKITIKSHYGTSRHNVPCADPDTVLGRESATDEAANRHAEKFLGRRGCAVRIADRNHPHAPGWQLGVCQAGGCYNTAGYAEQVTA